MNGLAVLNRPIRVVMFGSGPELNSDAKEFLIRLEDHPEIQLLGAFCQAQSQSPVGVALDLFRRRSWLALPLFSLWLINKLTRYLQNPRAEIQLRKKLDFVDERIHFVRDIHAPEVLEKVQALAPDLGLIYGSPILKPALFEIPKLGTLGIHHGKVPEYRGNKTTFWAMYNGEKAVGVTIQKVNQGLDTGSIVKAGELNASGRRYQTVFRDLEALGLDLYLQAILDVKQGTAEFQPQIGKKGPLYRNPKPRDFLIFWWKQIQRQLGHFD